MPNILLTNFCNRNCSYCFAKAKVKLGTFDPDWEMPEKDFETILSYLNPQKDSVSLLGGEPTLHSKFAQIVNKSIDLGYNVKIFTNGATRHLRSIADITTSNNISVILNLNYPDTYAESEMLEIEKNFACFSGNISLSFNIFEPDFQWEYLKKTITKWNLSNFIRLGVTQPIIGIDNGYLSTRSMKKAMSRVVDMAEDLSSEGIIVGFDCGFQQCSFTEDELGRLTECGSQIAFNCSPILDIGPELKVWRCFPFSMEEGICLTDYNSLKEIIKYFETDWKKRFHTDDSCVSCSSRMMECCPGGCFSRKLKAPGDKSNA